MRHTIDEAALLVGRTRRSLYRAMNESRLVYGQEINGRRYIDTAELLRAYGPFKAPSQDTATEMSHGVTVPSDLAELIGQAVAKAVAEAVEPLRQEIERLRLENAEQRLLEHKPDTPAASAISPADPPKAASSFADLLAGLGED